MNESPISWCTHTWNPYTGCSRVSPGCARCYFLTDAERKRGTKAFPNGGDLTYRWHKIDDPRRLKKPARIFVNSTGDLFWESVTEDDIRRVFDVMNEVSRHHFLILTKRSRRLAEMASRLTWTPNIWQGVSVENQHWTSRLDDLRQVPAAIRFVSFEPLLGPIDADLTGINWVIVGGESGNGFRPMDQAWARGIRDTAVASQIPFFFKQDAARRAETRPWLVEADGLKYEWHQFPGAIVAPSQIEI
jgi:protein gp37